jgi:hypothetical protein
LLLLLLTLCLNQHHCMHGCPNLPKRFSCRQTHPANPLQLPPQAGSAAAKPMPKPLQHHSPATASAVDTRTLTILSCVSNSAQAAATRPASLPLSE